MVTRLIPLLLSALMCVNARGQTPTILTVGGNNPDFQTIAAAINFIPNNPTNPFIINLRDGVYHEVAYVENINGASAVNTITLQSESQDSNAVTIIFEHAYYPVITLGDYHILKNVTVVGHVDVGHAPSAQLLNNRITGNVNVSHSDYFIGIGNQISGRLRILQSEFSTITDNIVNGEMDLGHSDYSTLERNTFNGYTHSSHSPDISFIGNDILGDFRFSYAYNSTYIGNIFRTEARFSYGTYGIITNNIFHSDTYLTYCDWTKLKFNSFSSVGSSSRLDIRCPATFNQNNLPLSVDGWLNVITFYGNNYSSGIPFNDPAPLFIDPMYDSELRATNPQLIGTGHQDTLVVYDIDSLLRSNPPTVGANELCITDTVNIYCGDTLVLGLCALPNNGDYSWWPSSGLNFDNVQHPRVSTTQSRWYTVYDATSGFTDSVYVNTIPVSVAVSASGNNLLCGQQTGIVATYHAGATYGWFPSTGLSSTTSSATIASPVDTTTYYVTVDVPGCGLATDSITIQVNPLPTAYVYLESSDQNFFQFLNASICADTYNWNFGDSTFSSQTNPGHFFPDTGGTFLVTLIACNSFGCDTFQGSISFQGLITGLEREKLPNSFTIYPNPTTEDLTISFNESPRPIELRVFDGLGRCVYSEKRMSEQNMFINLPSLSNGHYSVSVFDGNIHKAQKLIVSH